jgi:hypothetical protein
VPFADLALHVLALLVYPGALLMLAVGAAAESAATLALDGAGVRAALLAPAARLRRSAPGAMALLGAVALMGVLAATQLAAPLNPVGPTERSLLVAVMALAAAVWLGWARCWTAEGARLALVAQVCWLVALLAPALVSETLRPQALGSVVVPVDLPLKVAAGVLALLCLPALLQVGPGAAPPGGEATGEPVRAARLFLWLPFCGLFASLFFPPGADDPAGLLRFLATTAAAAAVTIALALAAARAATLHRLYPSALAALTALVLAIAAVTSIAT